jgi:hypothetical protein
MSLFYDLIMVSTILKRVFAFTACGFSAGSRTTSPVFSAMGLPATVISASPSTAFVKGKDGNVSFFTLQDDAAHHRAILVVHQT